jgi:hypothetical protein
MVLFVTAENFKAVHDGGFVYSLKAREIQRSCEAHLLALSL